MIRVDAASIAAMTSAAFVGGFAGALRALPQTPLRIVVVLVGSAAMVRLLV